MPRALRGAGERVAGLRRGSLCDGRGDRSPNFLRRAITHRGSYTLASWALASMYWRAAASDDVAICGVWVCRASGAVAGVREGRKMILVNQIKLET